MKTNVEPAPCWKPDLLARAFIMLIVITLRHPNRMRDAWRETR